MSKPTEIPPPNQMPPPDAPKQAPPVFGVTMSSVVGGDATMAVPVGNTTMTRDRTAKAGDTPPAPYAGEPSATFQPVPDAFVTVQPTVLYEVNSEDIYPSDARALGIEGVVKLSVGIDATGHVVQVRVISKAGHGFDEAATKAMRRFRFSPARTNDGRAVPYRFAYTYRFESK